MQRLEDMEEVVRCESIHGNMRGEEIRMDMSTERPWAQVSLSGARDDTGAYSVADGNDDEFGDAPQDLRDDGTVAFARSLDDGGEDFDYVAASLARSKEKWKKSREAKRGDATTEPAKADTASPGADDDDVDEQAAMVERKKNAWLKSRGGGR